MADPRKQKALRGNVLSGTKVMEALIEASGALGYMCHHETDSRRTNPGFPDLVMVGYGRLLIVECKSLGEKLIPPKVYGHGKGGRMLPGQGDWLDAFALAGVETYVCRCLQVVDAPESMYREIGYDALVDRMVAIRNDAMNERVRSHDARPV